MFKFVIVISMVFAAAYAGVIALHAPVVPVAHVAPVAHIAHVAPVAHVAHVAPIAVKAHHVPVATSYQSHVQISHGAVPVVAAPVLKTSPILAVGHHF